MNINEVFVTDIKNAIEKFASETKTPSTYFKPSGMSCERVMYYTALGFKPAAGISKYNWINAADTGSRRHEGIQETLVRMTNEGYNWEYIDVETYIKEKQAQGKCLDVRVGSKHGMETHLYHDKFNLSFLCDGIVRYKPTGEYFLFEFKNKKSEKYKATEFKFPMDHYDQCVVYCMVLDLEKTLLLMEDRNTLELSCPELFIVTDEMKTKMQEKIFRVLDFVNKQELPGKPESTKNCMFCPFKIYCEN